MLLQQNHYVFIKYYLLYCSHELYIQCKHQQKDAKKVAREMAQQLAAFTEDLDLVHNRLLTTVGNSSSKNSNASSL